MSQPAALAPSRCPAGSPTEGRLCVFGAAPYLGAPSANRGAGRCAMNLVSAPGADHGIDCSAAEIDLLITAVEHDCV